jgi:mannose-6-phosphate isomerase-like protein (cupin superfamily)
MSENFFPRTSTLRRIVTGHNENGRSIVIYEGGPDPVLEFFPGAGLFDIWSVGQQTTQGGSTFNLEPSPGGIKCRWFTVLPEPPTSAPIDLTTFYDDAFSAMSERDIRPDTSRHPGMHKTNTFDFIIVLEGQVTLMLDDEDRLLGPGDVVIQRGTNHAWTCAGSAPALLVAVLIDNERLSPAIISPVKP